MAILLTDFTEKTHIYLSGDWNYGLLKMIDNK